MADGESGCVPLGVSGSNSPRREVASQQEGLEPVRPTPGPMGAGRRGTVTPGRRGPGQRPPSLEGEQAEFEEAR